VAGPQDRTYGIAAFASLAGVTPRALRHYDRLGLLRPQRTRAGYRVYTEGDLATLEEIVALKFIGVPLKEIRALRRRTPGPFVEVLRAQRALLDERRRRLTQAIAAVSAAESALASGAPVDAALFRRIIEVMQMDSKHDETIATYVDMLKAKVTRLAALSPEERTTLRQQWTTLLEDINASLDADPASPAAQALLDRWLSLLQGVSGRSPAAVEALGPDSPVYRPTPDLQEEIWARRAEWLPPDAASALEGVSVEEARERARQGANAFAGSAVLDFIRRARETRG
jgi:DNA-binding transcriptional MerR regulator